MKVILTGNPTADYFNPLIAVSEELNLIVDKENLADVHLYYISDKIFDKKSLYENGVIFKKSYSSKNKFSFLSLFGVIISLIQVFGIYQPLSPQFWALATSTEIFQASQINLYHFDLFL